MNKHVWLQQTFGDGVLYNAFAAFQHARHGGCEAIGREKARSLSIDAACRFTGYAVETVRQAGGTSICWCYQGAVRSHHRYARGKNRDNYLRAGVRMLCAILQQSLAETQGEVLPPTVQQLYQSFYDGDPCGEVLHDLLEEYGYSSAAALLRGEEVDL